MPQWLNDFFHSILPWLAQRLPEFPGQFWLILSAMSPYLLFGFFAAGLLSVLIRPEAVERHLGGRGLWPVLKASAFGVPLAVCSCGVVPVAASLRRHGASKGAMLAFLISTPQTGADSFFATFSLLGLTFAIFRPIAALISGVVGGMAVDLADGGNGQARSNGAKSGEAAKSPRSLAQIFRYGFATLPEDIGRSMLVGLLIAGLMAALIPSNYFSALNHLGGGIVTMLMMMLLSIPVYVCATASVPVAAAFIMAGVSPGAALVFLMMGPASNAATITTIWKVLGRRSAIIYLLSIAVTSLASGLVLDHVVGLQAGMAQQHMHMMIPPMVSNVCAAILLAVLVRGVYRSFRPARSRQTAEGDSVPKTTMRIEGMTCSHCAAAVEKALQACKGVRQATVSLPAKQAEITGEGFREQDLRAAVEALGYRVASRD